MGVTVNRNGNHYKTHRILLPNGETFVFSGNEKDEAREPYQGVTIAGSLADTTSASSDLTIPQKHGGVKGDRQTEYDNEIDLVGKTL